MFCCCRFAPLGPHLVVVVYVLLNEWAAMGLDYGKHFVC